MPQPKKRSWKNDDGTTSTVWQVRYKGTEGRQRSRQFKKRTGPEGADAFCRRVEREVSDGTHVPNSETVTVAEAADIWIEAARLGRNGREPAERSTIDAYERHARLHIVPFLGALPLTKVSSPRVVAFRDELLRHDRTRAMTKKVLASLAAIFSEAKTRGLVGANPAEGVTIINSGRHREEVVIPEREEIRAMIEVARGWIEEPPRANTTRSNGRQTTQRRFGSGRARWFYTMLRLIASTGLRLSEVRGLRWEDVDLSEGSLEVSQRADAHNKIGPPKSASAFRRIDLPRDLVRDLKEWRLQCPKGPDGLVFPNKSGRIESQSNLYNRFLYPLLREAELVDCNPEAGELEPRYGFHSLRHFRASVLIASGADVKEVQTELGHSTAQMTLDTYGHLFSDAETLARRRTRAQAIDEEVFG